jgi:hypothetical protein
MTADRIDCPECGFSETGRFCRHCGKLLQQEPLVLCPRCHQAVPEDRFCNACGQMLTRSALRLVLLESLGEAFWVPSEEEEDTESIPEWLADFPDAPAAPKTRYTELSPARGQHPGPGTQPFVLLALALLVGLVVGVLGLLVWLLLTGPIG